MLLKEGGSTVRGTDHVTEDNSKLINLLITSNHNSISYNTTVII